VRKVRLEQGQLVIEAKGPLWSFVPDVPQGSVQVAAKIGADWVCAEFGGEVKKDLAGRFEARSAPAPGACELEVCGNGTVDPGEACDDGNLVDDDECTNACASGTPCVGEPFDSTFAALEGVVFEGYGCTMGFCHGSGVPPSGDLSLLPGVAYGSLVGVESVGVPGLLRVEAGDAGASFLYDKLAAGTNGTLPAAGSAMPAIGDPLTADELEAVRLWIEGGAPETGTVPETAELLGVCLP
jgi:cysteine-rich repeat protein